MAEAMARLSDGTCGPFTAGRGVNLGQASRSAAAACLAMLSHSRPRMIPDPHPMAGATALSPDAFTTRTSRLP